MAFEDREIGRFRIEKYLLSLLVLCFRSELGCATWVPVTDGNSDILKRRQCGDPIIIIIYITLACRRSLSELALL